MKDKTSNPTYLRSNNTNKLPTKNSVECFKVKCNIIPFKNIFINDGLLS